MKIFVSVASYMVLDLRIWHARPYVCVCVCIWVYLLEFVHIGFAYAEI